MLENLEVGTAQSVEPAKMARKKENLPSGIAEAWDATPLGEAKALPVKVGGTPDRKKVAGAILRLLRAYAKSQGLVAFKASCALTDEGLSLYWQKKPARDKKPEPAILPMPSESVTTKPKGRRVLPAVDEHPGE